MKLDSLPSRISVSWGCASLARNDQTYALNFRDNKIPEWYSRDSGDQEQRSLRKMAEDVRKTAQFDQLLEAIKAGDRTAFADLYQLTATRLLPIALRIMRRRDLAEDVLQEVYLTIWRKSASYKQGYSHPIAWMSAITRNHAIDRLRRDRKHAEARRDWEEGGEHEVEAQHQHLLLPDHLSRSVRQCVESLKENYRNAVLLAYYYGLTHEELATQLDCPLGTAKSRVRRGLSQLKDCMEQ